MEVKDRKIICFVCSQELPSLNSWKTHIVALHELEQEYLLCPECQIPCRDIRSHYTVHHKQLEVPILSKYRVDKLLDWDEKYRRALKKKQKWKEGFFDSIKMGKQIHFRSSWERDVMICLEKCVDVIEYYGDDHLCIPYVIHGTDRRYYPDFTIKTRDNKTIIIEIKPMDQTEWEINKAKWKYAVAYCETRQWDFQVWTQKHIRKIKTRALRHDTLLQEHVFPDKEEVINEINNPTQEIN